jgi:hypothetical protein
MQRWTRWTLALAALVVLTAASQARALLIAPPVNPGPMRVAQADAIIVGRVVAHEDKDVEVALPGGGKQTFRIAVVNVAENIKGMKDAKTVRVGFFPPPKGAIGDPAVLPIRPGIRPGFGGPVNLTVGQDGLLFLTKHPKENFYTAANFNDAVPRSAPNFEKDLADTKKTAKLLDNPMESLKSANAEDRLTTASMLITKYRQVRFPTGKTEAIPAEESKLILKAIREGNWEVGGRFDRPNSWMLFSQLGLTPKDGWMQPAVIRDVRELHKAAQEWLDKNADTYRIQRIIPGEPTGVTPGPVDGGPIRILPVEPGVRPIRPVPLPIKKIKIDLDR